MIISRTNFYLGCVSINFGVWISCNRFQICHVAFVALIGKISSCFSVHWVLLHCFVATFYEIKALNTSSITTYITTSAAAYSRLLVLCARLLSCSPYPSAVLDVYRKCLYLHILHIQTHKHDCGLLVLIWSGRQSPLRFIVHMNKLFPLRWCWNIHVSLRKSCRHEGNADHCLQNRLWH